MVRPDLALARHICAQSAQDILSRGTRRETITVEVLVRVDPSVLRGRPRCRVHSGADPRRVVVLHPVDQQRDGVLGPRDASQVGRGPARPGRGDSERPPVRDHGRVDVDVVRVEVVGDVRVPSGPGFEGRELRFGLRHVGVEVVEVAQLLCFGPGVGVCGVVSFAGRSAMCMVMLVDQLIGQSVNLSVNKSINRSIDRSIN